jgi:hypothetical protein
VPLLTCLLLQTAALAPSADIAAQVLRMLVTELWTEPCSDPGVICKLLCCSKELTALVHESCKGKLVAHFAPRHLSTAASGALTCSWLAKHAQLLQELHVQCPATPGVYEEWVAAGLRAAAGAASMTRRRTRKQKDPAARAIMEAEDAAAAAIQSAHDLLQQQPGQAQVQVQHGRGGRKRKQPAQQVQQQQQPLQMLPLLRLDVKSYMGGSLVSSLPAACMQLTQLHLQVSDNMTPGQNGYHYIIAYMAQLRNLRELSVPGYRPLLNLANLQRLTQLTKLDVPHHVPIEYNSWRLPASLVDLSLSSARVSSAQQIRELTNLECLRCSEVDDPAFLPPQLQSLVTWGDFHWHEDYLQLAQLRCLDVDAGMSGDPDLAPLTRMTQLTALKVTVAPWSEGDWDQPLESSALFQMLPKLPLVHLDVCDNKIRAVDLQRLGQCTKLTYLRFDAAHIRADVEVLAEQLQKLRGLEGLSLVSVVFRPHPRANMCELLAPLVQCVQGLAGEKLRSVFLRGLTLSAAQTQTLQQALGTKFDYLAGQLDSDSCCMDTSDMSDEGWLDEDGGWSDEDGGGDDGYGVVSGGWDSDSVVYGDSDDGW